MSLNKRWKNLEVLIESVQEEPRGKTNSPTSRVEYKPGIHIERDWSILRRSSPTRAASRSNSPMRSANQTMTVESHDFRIRTLRRKLQTPSELTQSFAKTEISDTHEGLTNANLREIYAAKCKDLLIPKLVDQERRFFEFCYKNLKDRKFSLKDHGIGPCAGKIISQVLRNNPYFAFLVLARNTIRDEGIIEMWPFLLRNHSLVHINISSNDIGTEGTSIFFETMSKHKSVTSIDISSPEGLNRNRIGLKGSKALKKLIKTNEILTILNVEGNSLGPDGFLNVVRGLEHNRSLLSLNLNGNDLGPESFEIIMNALHKSNVIELGMANNKLGTAGCESIHNVLSNELGICRLQKLDISRNNITATGARKVWTALKHNQYLSTLIMDHNPINATGVQGLQQVLKENYALKSLNFSSCDLGPSGLVAIGQMLQSNSGLKSLFLQQNAAENDGARGLANGLKINKTLKLLDISTNRISSEGGTYLAKALEFNTTLEKIVLKENFLNNKVGQMLAEVMQKNKNLVRLQLESNPINKKYLKEISANLKLNRLAVKRHQVPQLTREIQSLWLNDQEIVRVSQKIEDKKQEVKTQADFNTKHSFKRQKLVGEEQEKYDKLHAEHEKIFKVRLELDKDHEELTKELRSETSFGESQKARLENLINNTQIEIKGLGKKQKAMIKEKEENIYARELHVSQLKGNLASEQEGLKKEQVRHRNKLNELEKARSEAEIEAQQVTPLLSRGATMPLVREVTTEDQGADRDELTGLDTVASAKYLASEKLREKRKNKKPASTRTSKEKVPKGGKKKAAKSSSRKRN